MPGNPNEREFKPLNIAVMTVSDTRTEANDKSGDTLVRLLTEAGHRLAEKSIVPDDIYRLRAVLSRWIADAGINAVITTGGTGITGRDSTPEAVKVLLEGDDRFSPGDHLDPQLLQIFTDKHLGMAAIWDRFEDQ